MGVEGGVAIAAALVAGSISLLGFGLDAGIESGASIVVLWRLAGSRRLSPGSERRGRQVVAVSFLVLGPYLGVEAGLALARGEHPASSLVGMALTAFTMVFEPSLGIAKRRLGRALGSATVGGEGAQNLVCAAQAGAVLLGLLADAALGWWWLDGVVALGIALVAVRQGVQTWSGDGGGCGCCGPVAIPEQAPVSLSPDRRS
jgi:divalent metal cation (Fe/Co/Zn/Cd) transporter